MNGRRWTAWSRGTTMKSVTILVIEDEDMILQFAQITLEDAGYHVIPAIDGDAALTAINTRIDELAAMVTDIRLPAPGPDGWEIARQARELKPSVPIIYT